MSATQTCDELGLDTSIEFQQSWNKLTSKHTNVEDVGPMAVLKTIGDGRAVSIALSACETAKNQRIIRTLSIEKFKG